MISKRVHFDNSYRYDPRPYEYLSLYQIGDLKCEGGYEIGKHQQYCYEISYIVSGKGDYYTNGKAYALGKGDVYLGLPGQIHNGIADALEPFRFLYFGFDFDSNIGHDTPFAQIKERFDQTTCPVCKDKFKIDEPYISILSEIVNGRFLSNTMIMMNMYKIVILAYRNFFESRIKEYSLNQSNDSSKIIVFNIINYIDSNLENITELSEVAAVLGYSYPYLSRVFTAETGSTIQEYYENQRFGKATELLEHSDMSITQISQYLKYQSIHSFSKAFHKRYGLSPSKWQTRRSK
jgi:AraC-like DNA-binding protein